MPTHEGRPAGPPETIVLDHGRNQLLPRLGVKHGLGQTGVENQLTNRTPTHVEGLHHALFVGGLSQLSLATQKSPCGFPVLGLELIHIPEPAGPGFGLRPEITQATDQRRRRQAGLEERSPCAVACIVSGASSLQYTTVLI